ncbi:MAG: peptidoglycan-binding protein [Synergistaceae bacterium]|jgi:hypothetical protein|nr:peptidoglycan-binding protein [Synergistaceae bacterium]
MGALKKYLVYAIILAVLSAAAVFLNELRTAREYAEHPEFAVKTPPAPSRGEEFRKPSQSGLMDSSELAWMLREGIILDVWDRIISDGPERERYNARVREYNDLAVAIEYRESAMNSAVTLVERSKGEVVRSSEDEAMSLVMPENIKKDARASVVWRVQKYLKLLGYYAGDITGKEERKTTDAVKTFEIRTDSEPTGKIDEPFAKELREIWISRNIPVSVGFGGSSRGTPPRSF